MEEQPLEPFIKLSQFLKLNDLVQSGGEAKHLIQSGYVLVNGDVEVRRGRKLYAGDQVTFEGQTYSVNASTEG
ncbi:MAG: RNA-binding S4 domain-containing protein [Cyanobacteria bacterium J06642_11]